MSATAATSATIAHTAPFDLTRSDCFAEDLYGLLMPAPQPVSAPLPRAAFVTRAAPWCLPLLTVALGTLSGAGVLLAVPLP